MENKKKIIIIGAGPAGLTLGYELLTKSASLYDVIILEQSDTIGGLSKTIVHDGNRMDIGGHRFFTKIPEVEKWWTNIMPIQGSPAKDYAITNRNISLNKDGPDPEVVDNVMLKRHRVSRIYFDNNFYDYPISFSLKTLRTMGFINTTQVFFSYIFSLLHKRKEDNLENFYINRFGKKLYKMFFEFYTENLWGKHPSKIDASWGEERVKGISISYIIKDMLRRIFRKKEGDVETSVISEFLYPKLGPGQLWEIVANKIINKGGKIIKEAHVVKIKKNNFNVNEVVWVNNNEKVKMYCDYLVSSMAIKDLIECFENVPDNIRLKSKNLPYRDYITLGVLLPKLKLCNTTNINTINDIVPDCWIYVHDRNIKMGRLQIYNNWSPYLLKDYKNTVWVGLEYFVNEGDKYWNMSNTEFAKFAIAEMVKIGLIGDANEVLDYHIEKVKKAYPAYFDGYRDINKIKSYLDSIDNLYCIGRNGQHKYNNLDISMQNAFMVYNELKNQKKQSGSWE